MKNIIPLIVAVILALAAVFIVSRVLVQNDEGTKEPQVSVVIAARDLDPGEEITPGACSFKSIPRSAVPKNALLWESVSLAYGQKIPYKIPEGDYIQLSDLQLNVSLADCVEKGKWLIPVTFSDPALVKMLVPEDEIAIVASYSEMKMTPPSPERIVSAVDHPSANPEVSRKRETIVLFPCVKVTGIANDRGSFREPGGNTATIFISLPPQQATILLAAQREAELYPVLRKRNDATARNRRELGSVNAVTFERMRANLETTELPDVMVRSGKQAEDK
ncbi:MAG: SAF domain-containing protein [Lentisphaeria bacterium]|nr:SAF domain-containing protein [Lentisphaeria bacterium]